MPQIIGSVLLYFFVTLIFNFYVFAFFEIFFETRVLNKYVIRCKVKFHVEFIR
jgi:hypothetical protein